MHQHKCSLCETTWQHGEEWDNVIWAHECPKCGCHQFRLYKGSQPTEPSQRVEALSDPSTFVRSTTAFALDVKAAPAPTFVPKLAELATTDPEPMVRLAAVEALWRFGSHAVPAVPAIARALEDKRSEVRRAAALTLANLGPAAKAAAAALGSSLSDVNPRVRQAAALALSKVHEESTNGATPGSSDSQTPFWFSMNS